MKKTLLGFVLLTVFVLPAAALANSNVNATADGGSSISPSGSVVVPTGFTQNFSIGAAAQFKVSDVSVDGSSVGAQSSVGFTGIALDAVNHTIIVSSQYLGGGGLVYCSGPMAPGWRVDLPNGGCPVANPLFGSVGSSVLLKNANGSYTLWAAGFEPR